MESSSQSGILVKSLWCKEGKRHREDGPALEYFYNNPDKSPLSYTWYKDGNLHCESGPASVDFYENGTLECREWYISGKRHREDGPAIEDFSKPARPKFVYYLDNELVTKAKHRQLISLRALSQQKDIPTKAAL
jgi:hypothetical protein